MYASLERPGSTAQYAGAPFSTLQYPSVPWSALAVPCNTLERPSVPVCGAGGSCWAFAASRVFSDRLYRASAGRWNIAISEQNLVSCNLVGAYVHRASSLIRCIGECQPSCGLCKVQVQAS